MSQSIYSRLDFKVIFRFSRQKPAGDNWGPKHVTYLKWYEIYRCVRW